MTSRLSPRVRVAAVVVGWLAAAGAATGAGMFAVASIGEGIVPAAPQPTPQQELAALANRPQPREPAGQQTGQPNPPTTQSPATQQPTTQNPPAQQPKVLSTQGGTILARCAGQRVVISSASPAQGFQVDEDDDDDGGGHHAEVKFSSDNLEVKARVYCAGGEPRVSVERKIDD